MKELTKEQLKSMNDFLDKMEQLANETNRTDYQMLFYEMLMKEKEKENEQV